MALVGEGIDDLDLAILDINEAIDQLAGAGEKGTSGVGDNLAGGP
jgi:hypothetical protein